MIGETINELHEFAKQIGLKRHYFENPRKKRHPHYDLMNDVIINKAIENGAIVVETKEIVKLCRKFYGERIL
jgi:hypothetical protein